MPEVFKLGSLLIPTLKAALMIAFVIVGWWAARIAKERNLSVAWLAASTSITFWVGVIAARVGFVLANFEAYRPADPLSALYLWQPGFLPWVGVLTGTLVALAQIWQLKPTQRLVYLRLLGESFAIGALFFAVAFGSTNIKTSANARQKSTDPFEVRLVNLSQEPVTLSSLRGKAVILNFWATWCPPCRREMPLLESVFQEYKSRGLMIVGVDMNENLATVKPFIESFGYTYPIWLDEQTGKPGFDHTQALFNQFGGTGLPTTLFLQPDGTIQSRVVGELNRGELVANIKTILRP